MELANNSDSLAIIPVYFINGSYDDNSTLDEDLNRDPLYIVIPITFLYILIFLLGLIGNVSTCIVIARNRSMHTATNYYLFSLAVSDLLLLVSGLPPEICFIWSRYPYPFGEVVCVLLSFAAETSANATVLTITAFTVERYVAICHPFQAHAMSKLSRAVKLVLAIWLIALGLAAPQAAQFGVVQRGPGKSECTVKRVLLEHSFLVSTGLFFVAPMSMITVLYILIGLRLRRTKRERAGRPNLSIRSNHAYSQSHVIKMLVAVVVAFFICWAPFHAQRLLAVHAASTDPGPIVVMLYDALTYVSGVLYYLSTTVNPVLYHIMSNKFREAFRDTLARECGWGHRRDSMHRSYSTLRRPTLQSSARRSTQRRVPRSPIHCGPTTLNGASNNVTAADNSALTRPDTELRCFPSPMSPRHSLQQTSPRLTPKPSSAEAPTALPSNGMPCMLRSTDKTLTVRRSVSLECPTRPPVSTINQPINNNASESRTCSDEHDERSIQRVVSRPIIVDVVRKEGASSKPALMLRKDIERSAGSSDSGSGTTSAVSNESNRLSSASDFLTCADVSNSSCYQSTDTLVGEDPRWIPVPDLTSDTTLVLHGVEVSIRTRLQLPRVLSLESSNTGSGCVTRGTVHAAS